MGGNVVLMPRRTPLRDYTITSFKREGQLRLKENYRASFKKDVSFLCQYISIRFAS